MTDAGPAPGGDWPRPVVHFEIGAADPDRLAPFYAALFSLQMPHCKRRLRGFRRSIRSLGQPSVATNDLRE